MHDYIILNESKIIFYLPVVFVFLNHTLGFLQFVFPPIGVIAHKPTEPETAGKSHQHGLQSKQGHNDRPHPVKNSVVINSKSHPNQYLPRNKTANNISNAQRITDIAGAIIKSNLYLRGLATDRTMLMHF